MLRFKPAILLAMAASLLVAPTYAAQRPARIDGGLPVTVAWTSVYNAGGGATSEVPNGIALGPDGHPAIVSRANTTTHVEKYNSANGGSLWVRDLNTGQLGQPLDIAANSLSEIIVGGSSGGSGALSAQVNQLDGATTLAVVVSIVYTLFRAQSQQYQNSLRLSLHGVGVVTCMDYSPYWKSLYIYIDRYIYTYQPLRKASSASITMSFSVTRPPFSSERLSASRRRRSASSSGKLKIFCTRARP